jgi:aldose 1-epimerase
MKIRIIQFITLMTVLSCQHYSLQPRLIDSAAFNTNIKGKQVSLYTLQNKTGMAVQITNYGGRVVSLWVPDKQGQFEDVVTGYNTIGGYLKSNEIYFGALIGRYGNRIADGKFSIDNQTYSVTVNNGKNHLHGGKNGFNNVVWDAKQVSDTILKLHYLSPDGEEGFPGNLDVNVTYSLTMNNELKIEYTANTDKATPVNLTNHCFFNLHGAGKGSINDHLLQVNASNYTPILEGLIPTGAIAPVSNTPFDFTKPTPIGTRVNEENEQLKLGFGYDHNFVLDGKGIKLAARVEEPTSGRVMEVITDEPGLQFYGGNFLNGTEVGKGGLSYSYRSAFCLETQHFPDSPNQPGFPSTILYPGKTYTSLCIYKFTVTK